MSKPIPKELSLENDIPRPKQKLSYDRFIRKTEVLDRIDISSSTLYSWIAAGIFPDVIKVGRNSFWSENAINQWMQKQIAKGGK